MCGKRSHSAVDIRHGTWRRSGTQGDLLPKHRGRAGRIHTDADLSASDFQNRHDDVLADLHGLPRPPGKNEHVPWPPLASIQAIDRADSHDRVRVNSIVFRHYNVQRTNLEVYARERSCEIDIIVSRQHSARGLNFVRAHKVDPEVPRGRSPRTPQRAEPESGGTGVSCGSSSECRRTTRARDLQSHRSHSRRHRDEIELISGRPVRGGRRTAVMKPASQARRRCALRTGDRRSVRRASLR